MTNLKDLGPMNGPAIGIILKELVRRVIYAIRNRQHEFEVHKKEGYSGTMDDVFTDADRIAQEIYLRSLRECFPSVGVIAEEDSLRIPSGEGYSAYFTVDPLDGTKAFVRRQSHGVGTMIALVQDGVVISAYVGDINTQEIYGFRPGSEKVHRITEYNTSETLVFGNKISLKEQNVLLRDPERKYSTDSQNLIRNNFRNLEVSGGSIGIWLARLWKREVGAVILLPGWETPWDSTPIMGISEKLGYKFLKPIGGGKWKIFEPLIPQEKYERNHEVLIVHEQDLVDLAEYIEK